MGRISKVILITALTWVLVPIGWASEFDYQVGRARADVTGPPFGIQLLGYVRADQIAEGVQTRQWARAFVIADSAKRTASRFASSILPFPRTPSSSMFSIDCERSSATFIGRTISSWPELIRTEQQVSTTTILPRARWGGGFANRISMPYPRESRRRSKPRMRIFSPANIFIAQGDVQGGGVNRSLPAYMNNPPEEAREVQDEYGCENDTPQIRR